MKSLILCFSLICLFMLAGCESNTDQPESLVLYKAKTLISLSEEQGDGILVSGDSIVAVGAFDVLYEQYKEQNLKVDEQFSQQVMVPGFINQHDHPWLGALTLSSHIISIEDWDLPSGVYPRANNPTEYQQLLQQAVSEFGQPDELFLSWGYHELWHGPLNRDLLDSISKDIPIAIWQRSVHEFIVNTKALALFGIDQAVIDQLSEQQKSQTNLSEGHFWEAGMLALSGQLFKQVVKPKRFINGLQMLREYWHQAGTTLVVEPGGLVNKNLSIMQNAVFASSANPFHMDYIADGKTMALKHMDTLFESTQQIQTWGEGMSRYYPKQIKLFSDGAVFSQLMQMSEGYLDGHHGEWIMEPELFKAAFSKYWDAGYQIHVHQNGDAGLDLILDTLADNLARNLRDNHRTVIVHFSFSREEQVERIKQLGAIVSVNPYYPIALTDKYSEVGIGPERSQEMVRLGDLTQKGVNYSLHSDMPMAPGQPLYLMWCAVNRIGANGNVVGSDQKITAEQALRAVTINAAYSMGLENQIGSIESGKFANFTVLAENPLTIDPLQIKDIDVVATVHEGRVFNTQTTEYPQVGTWNMIKVYAQLIWAKIFG